MDFNMSFKLDVTLKNLCLKQDTLNYNEITLLNREV